MSSTAQTVRKIPATVTIIAINVAVFLVAQFLTGSAARAYDSMALLVLPARGYVSPWWTFITSMFMHGGVVHILCNMFTLYYMGLVIERLYGSARFLAIYFVSGIAGGLTYVAVNMATGTAGSAVGASGAIFGLFGAYIVMLLIESKHPALLPQSVSKAQLSSFLGLIAVNVLISLSPGVAWQAHLGGLVAGGVAGALAYWRLRRKTLGGRR